MGMLQSQIDGMNRVKSLELSDLVGKKLGEVNTDIDKKLKDLVEQTVRSQSRAFHEAILEMIQSQQPMLKSNTNVLQELLKLKEELSEEVDEVKSGVGSSSESLSKQINVLSKGIERLPTSFPEIKEVDLSKVLNGIMNLNNQVKSIDIPKPEKVSFASIEKRISALEDVFKKRVHVFEIERKNDQISKVTVKVK